MRLGRIRQLQAALQLQLGHEARRLVDAAGARHVHIARDGAQRGQHTVQRRGVGSYLVDAAPREQGGRIVAGVCPRGGAHVLDGNLRDLGGLF